MSRPWPRRALAGPRLAGVLLVGLLLATAVADALPGASASAASGGPSGRVPSSAPAAGLPYVQDGSVLAFAAVGGQMVVGGTFNTVRPSGGTSVARRSVLAFDVATGALSAFAPELDGAVEALLPGPVPGSVYVGGEFTTVGGVPAKGLALLSLSTGALLPGFTAPVLNGAVTTLQSARGHLLVGGAFTTADGAARAGLLSVVARTGALDSFLTTALTGHHNCGRYPGATCGPTGPSAMSVSPDATRLVVTGNFTAADGVARDQIAVLSLSATAAAVDTGWATDAYHPACGYLHNDGYTRGVDFSPDGRFFVVVTTGADDPLTTTCDAAARFEASDAGGVTTRPTWVDSTGRDTLGSVQVTSSAVFVGGHQRWLNNVNGKDSSGPGAVPRPGLAALDPVNGLPLAWNPGRNPRGVGAFALLATPTGVWVGSDTDTIGNGAYRVGRFDYFPYSSGTQVASRGTYALPGSLYVAGSDGTLTTRTFSGSGSPGPPVTAPAGPVAWGTVRGAFLVGNRLWSATASGGFSSSAFDGSSFSSPQPVDPYDDPVWSSVKTGSKGPTPTYRGTPPAFYGTATAGSLTGLAYLPSKGRIYYTVSGKPQLFSRAFTPDSGIIGAAESVVPSPVSYASTAGMTISGSTLYTVDAGSGRLSAVRLGADGAPTGSPAVVSGPGVDWRGVALFVGPDPVPVKAGP